MEDVGKMRLLEFAKDMKFRSVIYKEDKVKCRRHLRMLPCKQKSQDSILWCWEWDRTCCFVEIIKPSFMKMVKLCEGDSLRFVLDLSYSSVVYM
jgi:hypothetical protein